MTCLETRGRLSEYALGVLSRDDAARVRRHLDVCAGCSKEAANLEAAVETVSLSLPPAESPLGLENRVVHRVTAAAGTRSTRSHARMRRFAVAALAAASLAALGVGWGFAERANVHDVQASTRHQVQQLNRELADTIASIGGRPLQASLIATDGSGFGSAVLVSSPRQDDFILIHVFPPARDTGPYAVEVLMKGGRRISLGPLDRTMSGDLIRLDYTGEDLSKVIYISIRDRDHATVMGGAVRPYTGAAAA